MGNVMDRVLVAILARDVAGCLPLYLRALELQRYPKTHQYLWIRTNNTQDATTEILSRGLDRVGSSYADVRFDCSPIERCSVETHHQWTSERFAILGKLRQHSIQIARDLGMHYFTADCDNILSPHVMPTLAKHNLPVVAPMLDSPTLYSNYHINITDDGYYLDHPTYPYVRNRWLRGVMSVPVVHCTYWINNTALP